MWSSMGDGHRIWTERLLQAPGGALHRRLPPLPVRPSQLSAAHPGHRVGHRNINNGCPYTETFPAPDGEQIEQVGESTARWPVG